MEIIIQDGLAFALPLFIMAIGGIYSEKSGITNLALEGLQGFGAFSGALGAVILSNMLNVQVQQSTIYTLSLLFAFIGGGLFALIHALLCIKFKANQVISGVVINILAMALTGFLTRQFNALYLGKPSNRLILAISDKITIPFITKLPLFGAIFTNVYPFELLILAIAFIAWYILYKTSFGLHLRAAGENPHALDSAGINVQKIRLFAVIISGALSGIAGISFAYSISANFSATIYSGYGFLAIAALIFGNWKILPTFVTCILFGIAKSGGYELIKTLKLPNTYSDILMTLPYVLTLILLVFFSKHNRAPKALGEIYDKSKR